MILAAVTQRRVEVPGRGSRDCLNRAWPAFLAACGVLAAPVPGDPGLLDAWLERVRPEAVILSGGNAAPGGGQDDACRARPPGAGPDRWAGSGKRAHARSQPGGADAQRRAWRGAACGRRR
jgi:hypothetical protein